MEKERLPRIWEGEEVIKFANLGLSMAFVLSLVRTIKIRSWVTGKCYLSRPKIFLEGTLQR